MTQTLKEWLIFITILIFGVIVFFFYAIHKFNTDKDFLGPPKDHSFITDVEFEIIDLEKYLWIRDSTTFNHKVKSLHFLVKGFKNTREQKEKIDEWACRVLNSKLENYEKYSMVFLKESPYTTIKLISAQKAENLPKPEFDEDDYIYSYGWNPKNNNFFKCEIQNLKVGTENNNFKCR